MIFGKKKSKQIKPFLAGVWAHPGTPRGVGTPPPLLNGQVITNTHIVFVQVIKCFCNFNYVSYKLPVFQYQPPTCTNSNYNTLLCTSLKSTLNKFNFNNGKICNGTMEKKNIKLLHCQMRSCSQAIFSFCSYAGT